ncbi:sulfotransferase [Paracoccus cavernae]|uniref:Sulfotransferase n=1 Tax=Paracoccus cavernae TaxID=1571207 RepID=A0ABT8D9B2_9RHOB|nr:sulfotransferase [Paracoccus cavernae]
MKTYQITHVWTTPFKELHFFDHKFLPENRSWTPWHVKSSVRKAKKLVDSNDQDYLSYLDSLTEAPMLNGNWYKRVFSRCSPDRIGIDITPEYCGIPAEGIEFVKKFLGADVRIIYIIRSPIQRALSQIAMNISRHKPDLKSLDDWIREASKPEVFERGDYFSHVQRWDAQMDAKSILYLPFGDIARDPLDFLRRIETFADIQKGKYPKATKVVFKGTRVDFPDSVISFLQEKLHKQSRFIEERFGSSFSKNT